jgi:hypothetical protein
MRFFKAESLRFILLTIRLKKTNLTGFENCEVAVLSLDYLVDHIKPGIRHKHIGHLYTVWHLVIL